MIDGAIPGECASIVWRRLDLPGHEAAHLIRVSDGWVLSGVAAFTHEARPCRLDYLISCDSRWLTRECAVSGFVGTRTVAANVMRSADGMWTADGVPAQGVAGCTDIDLAFSPVTNLLPIRRLELAVGASARVRAAWLRFPELTLDVLEQVYTRRGADRYLYESAGGAFRRELTVDASGLVLDYPGLWIAESSAGLLST
jgi:uncharacterized protein